MYAQVKSSNENKSRAIANSSIQNKLRAKQPYGFNDKRNQFRFNDNRKPILKNGPIQRTLQINGVPTVNDLQLINQINIGAPAPIGAAEINRIGEWSQSPVVHNFKIRNNRHRRKIRNNLFHTTHTTAEPKIGLSDTPALFGVWNYEHSTHQAGRLPTLYFDTNNRTGRLRQQHSTGPLAKVDANRKVRLGMATIEDQDRVWDAMGRANFNPHRVRYWRGLRRRRVPVNIPPEQNDFQIEYDMGTAPATGRHKSGGRVDRTQNYTQNDIDQIYNGIVGN